MNNEETIPNAEGPEKGILSCILQDPETYLARAKAENVTPSMFYDPARAKIFSLFLELEDYDQEIELISFVEILRKRNILESLGGASGIAEIFSYASSLQHFSQHVEIVRSCFAQRKAIVAASKVHSAALSGEDAKDALRELEEGLNEVRLATSLKRSLLTAQETCRRFLATLNERLDSGDMPGTPTGIREIDSIGGGMRKGEFWVICGETSAGKSALTYQMLIPAIANDEYVLIFTLEMGADEVFARLLSCRHKINLGSIMSPKGISIGEGKAIKSGSRLLSQSNMLICDEPNMSIDFICSQCEQIAESHQIGAIAIDYIQLVESINRKGETREQELSRISKRMKQLAKKIQCPVISPAQLNDDGKLRESRAIGQDADVVMKITDKGISVSKFRNAERDQLLSLTLNGKFQRFDTSY